MTLTNQQFRKLLTDAIEERKAHDRATRKANLLKEGVAEFITNPRLSPTVPAGALQTIVSTIRKKGADPSQALWAQDSFDDESPERQMLAQIINNLSDVENGGIRLGDAMDVPRFINYAMEDERLSNIFHDDVSEVYSASESGAIAEGYRYDRNADNYDRNRDDRGMSNSTIQFEKISAQGYGDGIRGNQIDPRYAKNGDYMIAYNAGQERLAAREEVDVE